MAIGLSLCLCGTLVLLPALLPREAASPAAQRPLIDP